MIFSRAFSSSSQPAGPPGYRAYAVGDIHGRLDLLDAILEMIEDDFRQRPKSRTIIVFLGDLVDRGPQSAQVVERLRTYRPSFAKPYFLLGNHEEVMLRVLAGETALIKDWLKFGGVQCVQSYGIDPEQFKRAAPEEATRMLDLKVPKSHRDFFDSFSDTLSFGSYLFVHAGIRPGVPLGEQSQTDLRWIRSPFLENPTDHSQVVVHGHTITEQVEVRANRIGLDTGAYRTGVLTALGIEGADRWFLQTDGTKSEKEEAERVVVS